MFRGITRSEQRITLGLLALAAVVLSLRCTNRPRPVPLSVSGPVEWHSPGELTRAGGEAPSSLEGLVDGRIDINIAGAELLETLPGIGPSRAAAIIQHRERHGLFTTPEQLDDVPGIGEKTLETLLPLVTVGEPAITPELGGELSLPGVAPQPVATAASAPALAGPPAAAPAEPIVDINRATAEQFATLSGIGEVLAARIVEDRRLNGPFRNVGELARVKGIGPKLLERNRHRLTVGPPAR